MTAVNNDTAREQQDMVRRSARDFVEKTVNLRRLLEFEASGGPAPAEIWRSLGEMEWTGLLVPEQYGGAGGALTDAAIIYAEMGRQLLPSPIHSSGVLAASILLAGGSEEQKHRLLPVLASGAQVFAPVISDDAFDPSVVQLRATARGGSYYLNGVQEFVPDAGLADQLIVTARTGAAEGADTLFMVDARANGVSTRRLTGWVGQPIYEVKLSGVEVSAASVLSTVGGAWEVLQPALRTGIVLLCFSMAGASERVWEIAMEYAHHRVQFGQPIARFQRVQDHLIRIRNYVDKALGSARQALEALIAGDPDVDMYVSAAKAWASEGFYFACEDAHHVHAGIGSVKEHGLYLYTKASHGFYSYLGSPDQHKQRLGELLAAMPA